MKRGDLYWASLLPRSGSEQSGRRPVIIVSNNGFNLVENWRSIIVVPISTSGNQARRGPTVVFIPAGKAGLKHDSFALAHQVTTLDRSKLAEKVGKLDRELLLNLESALKTALDLT